MHRGWVVDLVARLPQGAISRAWGVVARLRFPRTGITLLKHVFVAAAGIDMSEAMEPLGAYSSLEELFVRQLKRGARHVDPDPAALVSPVDATLGASGRVTDGRLLQVKGRTYSLERLLGDRTEAARLEGGSFATLYLSPKDYHRIHAPCAGTISKATLIPGLLFPVFHEAVASVDELFARNERLITYLDSPHAGRVAVVKVGATLVGRIRVTYDESLVTNARQVTERTVAYEPPVALTKGSELGRFEMGSTVVVIVEPGRVQLDDLALGCAVRMGQRIGTVSELVT